MINITSGMIHGGKVTHLSKGGDVTLCGRYVLLTGESDAPLCKTCSRVSGLKEVPKVDSNDARRMIAECGCGRSEHITPEAFTARRLNGDRFSATELAMFRDVIADYAGGAENDACWVGTLAILVKDPKLCQDIKPVESKRFMPKGDGMVNPNSTSVAKPQRKRGHGASEKQEALILSLISQIGEYDKEAADVLNSIHTPEWMNDTIWAKISEGIKSLFRILDTVKASAKAKEVKESKPAREWVVGSVYVIDGVFHRVHISKTSGRAYTQSWSEDNGWDYQGMKFLGKCTEENKITAEQAAKWGHEHDWCVFCSRDLDDERSRNAGYGPKCAENQGLPWGE